MVKENSKRIAKNTALLYVRMLLVMLVTLYTSRVVLNALGEDDFGLYSVVGSIVTFSIILTTAVSNSTQRFISFELGSGNTSVLKNVINLSVTISYVIAFIILILAETVGLWYLKHGVENIPADRVQAAFWVYQLSVLTFLASILQAPYNAVIVAHERMTVYAYVSFIEVALKLLSVFLLVQLLMDKLILYAVLMSLITLIVTAIYRIYSIRRLIKFQPGLYWDKPLFKSMFEYVGWSFTASFANVAMDQGITLLINNFFGLGINAARGIANNVKSSIFNFSYNYQVAVNPQIVKSYASNDHTYMLKLVRQSSKFSFLLLYLIIFPVFTEMDLVLKIWLKNVPEYAPVFCRLVLILTLIESLTGPLNTAASATRNIKGISLVTSLIILLGLPASYLLLKAGFPPQSTLYVHIFFTSVALSVRLLYLRKLVRLSIRSYLEAVVFRAVLVLLLSMVAPLCIVFNMDSGYQRLFVTAFISVFINGPILFFAGLNPEERKVIINVVRRKLGKEPV